MITVKEASDIILSNACDWGTESVSLDEASERVLAENIFADRDFPPFDRVTMDGIAIRYEDYKKGHRTFKITTTQTAGAPAATIEGEGSAVEVMTGAVLPKGADSVIRYEDLDISDDGRERQANLIVEEVRSRQNVHAKGNDQKAGAMVVPEGSLVSATEIGVMATVGKTRVKVQKLPQVAIVSTGDELVPIDRVPLAHQIRMSNAHTIQNFLKGHGIHGTIFHLNDNRESMTTEIKGILEEYDSIILSGGVSKGKADYIPDVLEILGVKKQFHRVAQRPGKPFWFGVSQDDKCVFALPGNPVSTFMCFIRYFMPWFQRSIGVDKYAAKAVLMENFEFRPPLTHFLQVKTSLSNDGLLEAYPQIGGGSGDLTSLVKSNGFLQLPSEQTHFTAGEVYDLFPFKTF